MGNIFRFLLVLPCITLLLYSCESEIENEIQSSTEKLNLSGLESDSLQLESYELSEMTDELKALKERIDELKKAKTRSVASSNYSQYFSENMWAIRELPFTLSTGTEEVSIPVGHKHGTIFTAPESVVKALLEEKK